LEYSIETELIIFSKRCPIGHHIVQNVYSFIIFRILNIIFIIKISIFIIIN